MSSVVVREVWDFNLREEICLIQQCLGRFLFVSMDTEFPGSVYHTDLPRHVYSKLSPHQLYWMMKQNVDALKLIQLGLTFSDRNGNLPRFGTRSGYVWQFNFRGFDSGSDPHNPEAISLLERQGIDFEKNKVDGIAFDDFAVMFKAYVLSRNLVWITFDGLTDFGYLIKILTGKSLPNSLEEFGVLLFELFGQELYDVKKVGRSLGLYGGLEKMATRLGLGRVAGKSHQAGSDSLLTVHLFMELMKKHPYAILTRHFPIALPIPLMQHLQIPLVAA